MYYTLLTGVVSLCACTSAPAVTAPTAAVSADAALVASSIEPAFYRAFLQNGFEAPDRLEPIRILKGPLRIYLRVQDDAGGAIDAETLDSTERILGESARTWSGETFGVAEVARGLGTRERTAGWLTVKWRAAPADDRCGRSTVGVDGGVIEFALSPACRCGLPAAIYPRLVRHELGHAMGYYHTDSVDDVMYGQAIPASACDLRPSDRERRLAQVAYGNGRVIALQKHHPDGAGVVVGGHAPFVGGVP